MKGIIYDCEIISCIPVNGSFTPEVNVKYCAGWEDFENMGIACIGVYELETGLTRVFLEDNFDKFQALVDNSELVIGFNSISFDDRLCAANDLRVKTNYDLLCQVRVASDQPPHYTPGLTRGGYSLDALSYANFGIRKSGNGALAPLMWQQGNYGMVIDYCLRDVQLTAKLFHQRNAIVDPTDGSVLTLTEPETLLGRDKKLGLLPTKEDATRLQNDDLDF